MPILTNTLLQYCPDSYTRSVSHDACGCIGLWVKEKSDVGESVLNGSKGCHCIIAPLKLSSIISGGGEQIMKGLQDGCTIRQKSTIEIDES